MLVDEFSMCPETVMRMPFVRFQALQRLAFKRSVHRKNERLKLDAQRNGEV